jgi:hypothetical protein
VAGSDAVASSLAFAFYYLGQSPRHADAIRSELAKIDIQNGWDISALQTRAPYLNAFIAEVLRLWPPNPSGVLRQTPKEGLKIDDRFIPGDVTVCTPFWALHRCKSCMSWLDKLCLMLTRNKPRSALCNRSNSSPSDGAHGQTLFCGETLTSPSEVARTPASGSNLL